jgi:RNA polymerase sigma-70 factor (ECF subfamily)
MGTVLALPRPLAGGQEAGKVEPAEERVLVAALAGGDREAAEALVERTYRRVFALLCRLAGDRDLAADLTQETYRRAWSALLSFDGRSLFSTWLYRIATNAFLNHVRRPHAVVPLDAEHASTLRDGNPPQDDEVIAAQTHERLRKAVLGLPEELRFTVAARYWAETPVAEIARAEGISDVAIRKRLKRAYRLLAVVLEEVSP